MTDSYIFFALESFIVLLKHYKFIGINVDSDTKDKLYLNYLHPWIIHSVQFF